MESTLQKIASSDATILVLGRTGSGKSHLAKEIHESSKRRANRFTVVNLATLAENLIESELFGHERGAFSGAHFKRVGKFEHANGGTLFLDEIGELPLRLQTKLLDALNSKTICPVGSNREQKLDVRVIVATNRNLAEMVQEKTFREDLFYRINTFTYELKDLCQTPDRIVPLALQFIEQASTEQKNPLPRPSDCFLTAIKEYQWPGNIRELKNAMEYAVAVSCDTLRLDSLPPYVKKTSLTKKYTPTWFAENYREAKSSFEHQYLTEALTRNGGGVNKTAKTSGLSKVTLIDKIKRYSIDINTIKYQNHLAQRNSQ